MCLIAHPAASTVHLMRRMTVDDLPARPDRISGFPRPPDGPDIPADPVELRSLEPVPTPPPGQGPVQSWFHGSDRHAAIAAGYVALIIFVPFSIINGLVWLTPRHWPVWTIFLVGVVARYWMLRPGSCAVGADWLARGRRWVQVYELTSIRYRSILGGPRLLLRDSAGRRVTVKLATLQAERLAWNLAYNGQLHSVVAGQAKASRNTRFNLRLPDAAPPDTPRSSR